MRVRVFRNLTSRCYSIQARVSGAWRTIAHAEAVVLRDVTCRVSEAGRQRVLRTGRKVVHAWLEGELAAWSGSLRLKAFYGTPEGLAAMGALTRAPVVLAMHTPPAGSLSRLSYNPRKAARFTVPMGEGWAWVVGAAGAVADADGVRCWAPVVDLTPEG